MFICKFNLNNTNIRLYSGCNEILLSWNSKCWHWGLTYCLTDPPLLPPVLASSSSENSIEKRDIITCSVSGGHPPVTSVTLGCSDPLLVYRLNTTEGSTRNTSLVFRTTPNTNESRLCYCHVLWEPDKGLYEHNVTRVFNIKGKYGTKRMDDCMKGNERGIEDHES